MGINTRSVLLAAALPIVAILQLGASCASTNDDDGPVYHDRPVYRDEGPVYREDGPPVYRDERPVYRDGPQNDDDRPNRIPRWADQVRDGHGKQRWTADFDGVIYVYDADKDFVPWTGPIRRGQEVIVLPGDDRISIDDHPVYTQNLRRDGRYEIYFERDGRRSEGSDWHRPVPPPPLPPPVFVHEGDLPQDAEVIQRGDGDLIVEPRPRDGTVFIFDEDDRRVVYRHDLDRGHRLLVDRRGGFIRLDDRRGDDVSLRRNHHYSLYFRQR